MANHVDTYVEILGLTPETIKKVEKRFSGIECGDSVSKFFPEGEDNHNYLLEHVGAKWCFLEEFYVGERTVDIRLTSAWSYPEKFIRALCEFIREHQEEFKVGVQYEDEMPNFAGAQVYVNGVLEDEDEFDWEHILDNIEEFNPRCHELMVKQEEQEELTQEEEDELWDNRWECVSESIHQLQIRTLSQHRYD